MITITIDSLKIFIQKPISILEACKFIGINIPKFCYHQTLSIAGNCRMCLVELQKTIKPVASCAMPIINNMVVFTSTPVVKKARENVLEMLLVNHPLDCPICDQGGECDLQDETKVFGNDLTRYFFPKRAVEDKYCGIIIKTVMTRCIHCTRCVRFSTEIAGNNVLGTINRGSNMEISNFISNSFNSFLTGNVIDLCPVGALTSKNYTFKARPWELKSIESLDLTDSSGTAIYFNYKESEIVRVLPKINKDLNETWISDRARFSFDSFTNSRLHSLFKRKNTNDYLKTNWVSIIKILQEKIKTQQTLTFLINDDIDFFSTITLKKLVNFSKNAFSVINVETTKKTNLWISWLSNKIKDINQTKVCFLIFVNIFIENVVINTKLKKKYTNEKFETFSFGTLFNSTFPINFNNICIKNIIMFFESKSKVLSKYLVKQPKALIVLGETITTKISSQIIIYFFTTIIPNLTILDVKLKSNFYTLKMYSVFNSNTNKYKKSDFFASLNLNDNYYLRKYLNNKKDNFWLNSHGSELAIKNKYILPTLYYSEENNIFFNMEQNPQQINPVFTKINDSKSTKFFLTSIAKCVIKKNNIFNVEYENLKFIQEIIKNSYLIKNFKLKLSKQLQNLFYNNLLQFNILYKYSTKSNVEDFFLINNFCRNSFSMNALSINYRKDNNLFFFST